MNSRRFLLLCGLASATAAACAGLRTAEISFTFTPEAGTNPPPPTDDDAASDNGVPAPPDAGEPPDDFTCDQNPWTLENKRPECVPRQVTIVSSTAILLNTGVSIARTSVGRVGVAYNFSPDADTSKLRVAHFEPTRPEFTPPVVVERETPDHLRAGALSRIAATSPDTLHVLSFDYTADNNIGTVSSQEIINGVDTFTAPDLVASAIAAPSEIGFAVDKSKNAYATVRLATSDTKAKMIAFTKSSGQNWSPLPDVPSMGLGLLPKEAPGTGASSLFIDGTERVHLLYHHNETINASAPRYHALAGASWTYRKTVDNNVPDGWCGFSPRLVVFGNRKYALYFYRKVAQDTPTPTAELRLATWVNEDDEPTREVIDQQIPAVTTQAPFYRAAMAIDKYGLIHLAIVRPSPNEKAGYLEYRRQQRVEGGGTRWLSDIVDPEVLSDSGANAEVDMVVDDNARPHIAYLSGVDRLLRYATRYDR